MNKAVTFDGLTHEFFKYNENDFLLNCWNNTSLSVSQSFFECRLVALNKKFPNIPAKNQFRPIVIVSPLVKFLELRFLPKLKDYMVN